MVSVKKILEHSITKSAGKRHYVQDVPVHNWFSFSFRVHCMRRELDLADWSILGDIVNLGVECLIQNSLDKLEKDMRLQNFVCIAIQQQPLLMITDEVKKGKTTVPDCRCGQTVLGYKKARLTWNW